MRRFVAATVGTLLWAGCGELMEPFPAQQNVTEAVFSNGTSDVTPPVLTVLDFSPAAINTSAGADQVTVDFSVTDDLSGAVSAFAQFRSPSGSNTVGFGDGFPASVSHSGSLVLQFPQFSEAGTWILDYVSIRDAVGNEVVYNASQLAALGFPTQLTVVSISDVTPPLLTALGFTPTAINTSAGADQVTVDFSVTDDLSGAVSAFAQFRSPSGSNTVGFGDGFPASVSHSGSLVLQFPQFSEAGTWILDYVSLRDAVGNEVVYNASQLAALGFPTQLTVQQTITVSIDITPGESPNVIRCRDRNNLLPVAILTTPDFDALSVDHATVVFGPGAATEAHVKAGIPVRHIQDVDRDGDFDLLFHFSLADALVVCGATEAELNGRTFGGIPIRGVDAIVSR